MARSGPILLVEDDSEIRDLVTALLRREGFDVAAVPDGAAMDARLAQGPVRLFILDVMLPGEDGLSLCRRLRAAGDAPILMLTAKGEEIDRIIGYEIGADDYLPKPFSPRELVARLKALLRRAEASGRRAEQSRRLAFDGVALDLDARSVTRDGAELGLSAAEFDLLAALAEAPGRVLSRDHLLDRVFGRTAAPLDRSIDVLVSRLRKKLEETPERPSLVKTVRNAGYVLAVRPEWITEPGEPA